MHAHTWLQLPHILRIIEDFNGQKLAVPHWSPIMCLQSSICIYRSIILTTYYRPVPHGCRRSYKTFLSHQFKYYHPSSSNVELSLVNVKSMILRAWIWKFSDQMICEGERRLPTAPVQCVTVNPTAADITCPQMEGLYHCFFFWGRQRDFPFVIPMKITPGSYFTRLVSDLCDRFLCQVISLCETGHR